MIIYSIDLVQDSPSHNIIIVCSWYHDDVFSSRVSSFVSVFKMCVEMIYEASYPSKTSLRISMWSLIAQHFPVQMVVQHLNVTCKTLLF